MKHLLAVIAVLLLSLRPACDVWAAAHGHASPGPVPAVSQVGNGHDAHPESGTACCATIQDGNLISAGNWALAGTTAEGKLSIAAPSVAEIPFARVTPSVLHPPDAPFIRVSYYARSARILR